MTTTNIRTELVTARALTDPEGVTAAVREGVGTAMKHMAEEIRKTARGFRKYPGSTRRRFGQSLADGIGSEVRDGAMQGTIFGTAGVGGKAGFIGQILEEGAKPHLIEPRRKTRARQVVGRGKVRRHRAVMFLRGGVREFRQFVRHPGVAATHWLEKTADREAPRSMEILAEAVDRSLRGAS